MLERLKNQKFKSQINTIELTKQLTREPCDSLSFTHRIGRSYVSGARVIEPSASGTYSTSAAPGIINEANPPLEETMYYKLKINNQQVSPVSNSGNINIYAITLENGSFGSISSPIYEVVVNYNDNEFTYSYSSDSVLINTIQLSKSGIVKLNYNIEFSNGQLDFKLNIIYTISVIESIPAKPIPSITDVINRILDVGVPRLASEEPKYKLDDEIAQKFANVPAPEFFLPRMTLYEALLTIGGYIHGIPRLVWNETTDKADTITFDLLGLDEEYELPPTAKIIGYKRTRGANDYCGALESYVENLVDTQNQAVGSVVEPFINGYKTVRCTSGVQINNETAVITTDKPIYRLVKLEMAYTDEETSTVIGDITNFVYEKAEYDTLFVSDAVGYPNSVAYALGYTQGGREIFGLNTASSSLLNILNSFKEPAIQNIVETLQKNMSSSASFSNLAFRVTYIPMDTVRVRARKPYNDFPEDNVLFDNQGAGVVEASFYGENMKGKVARLGNEVEMYTIRFEDQTQLPQVGNIFDNAYIFKITRSRGKYHTLANIYITPNFNKLSEYLGLNSNYRLYEVSEKQSINRNVLIERKIEIGHEEKAGINSSNKKLLVHKFWQTFTHSTSEELDGKDVANLVVMWVYGKNDAQIGEPILKSVTHHAFGNSLIFSWKLEDSYSAGYQADYVPPINGSNVAWKQRRNVQYGDIYGGFYSLEFSICPNVLNADSSEFNATWQQQLSTASEQGFCDKLPVMEYESAFRTSWVQDNYFNSEQIVIDKNSSEAISVTVQFYGQCTEKGIVMGKKLWDNNFAVNSNHSVAKPRFYFLPRKINMLRDKVDLTGAVEVVTSDTNRYRFSDNGTFYIVTSTNFSDNTYKAWALVDPTDGGLYIGENVDIEPNSKPNNIYFNFN